VGVEGGPTAPWYSETEDEFHLGGQEATHLLTGVIEAYRQQGGGTLNEIFLHSRSTINDEEFRGYGKACPDHAKLVGVRVR